MCPVLIWDATYNPLYGTQVINWSSVFGEVRSSACHLLTTWCCQHVAFWWHGAVSGSSLEMMPTCGFCHHLVVMKSSKWSSSAHFVSSLVVTCSYQSCQQVTRMHKSHVSCCKTHKFCKKLKFLLNSLSKMEKSCKCWQLAWLKLRLLMTSDNFWQLMTQNWQLTSHNWLWRQLVATCGWPNG